MRRSRTRGAPFVLLTLLSACDGRAPAPPAPPAPPAAPDPAPAPMANLLLVIVSGDPDGRLDWLQRPTDVPAFRLANLRRIMAQGVVIQPAAGPACAWPGLVEPAADQPQPEGFWSDAGRLDLVSARFGPATGTGPAQPAWWVDDPRPAPPAGPEDGQPKAPERGATLAEKLPGMTAPVRVDLTRPLALQLGDHTAAFIRRMAVDERSWFACLAPRPAELSFEPSGPALDLARQAVAPAEAPGLCAWQWQDDALGHVLSEVESVGSTAGTLLVVKGPAADSPIIVLWPDHIEGGGRFTTGWSARQVLDALCRQIWDGPRDRPPPGLSAMPLVPEARP